jgi:hypothetical protein
MNESHNTVTHREPYINANTVKGRSSTRIKKFLLCAGLFISGTCTGVDAARGKPRSCDCIDMTFSPSAERIQIMDSEAVKRKLLSSKESPLVHPNLRATLKTADIALQRHMNGDLYQFNDPTGWEKYNSPIISMNFEDWQAFAETEEAKPNVGWDLCPFAKRAAITTSATGTSVRYELIRVGRFTARHHDKDRRYDSSANGEPLFLTVTVNAANKVSELAQDPTGFVCTRSAYRKLCVEKLKSCCAHRPPCEESSEK